jgi:ferredoxin
MLSVRVDRDRCTAHGICESLVPTVFEVQPDGAMRILNTAPAEELRGQLEDAVLRCPMSAISLER